MTAVKLPLARPSPDSHEIVSATAATRVPTPRPPYYCPSCGETVSAVAGSKAPHFRHRPGGCPLSGASLGDASFFGRRTGRAVARA